MGLEMVKAQQGRAEEQRGVRREAAQREVYYSGGSRGINKRTQ